MFTPILWGLVFVVTGATQASAASESPAPNRIRFEALNALNRSRCSSQGLRLLDEWKASRDWIRGLTDLDGGKFFKTPTSQLGTWVEMAVYPDQSTELRRVSPETVIHVAWSSACEPHVETQPVDMGSQSAKSSFTDADLQKLQKEQASALIYVWSPQMPLSLRGYAEAKKVAEKHRLRFLPVLDPSASAEESGQEARRLRMPASALKRVNSIELAERGVTLHYPATVVFHRGKLGA